MRVKGVKTREVVAVYLETGSMAVLPSLTRASVHCGMTYAIAKKAMTLDTAKYGWYLCYADELTQKQERIRYLSSNYDTEEKARRRKPRSLDGLVELRVDSHTKIWVRPDEANEEFKKKYLSKLNKPTR